MDLLARLQTALGERYEIERELGRGGMATVFLARDLKHDRKVAVKVLHDDLAAAVGAERFQREIQFAGRLTHPHILPLHDSGRVNGSLYYVMPYIEGESLRSRMNRERQLPVSEAVRIACEVAGALSHAHRHGIIHRDIKPENILLEDGHAVVADFGIARAMTQSQEHITYTGMSVGTPGYMSPEQASGERDVDGRSDMYALACVLYEMLAGQPPFTGPNAQAVMARHALDAVPPLRTVRSTVPQEVEDAVLQALAKSPADRFATAAEFANALCTPTASRSAFRSGTSVRQRVRLPAAFALGIATMLAGGALAQRYWTQPGRHFAAGMLADDIPARQIAVLYFQERAQGDTTLGPLADGLSEALMEELGGVKGLRVISPSGVAPFRDAQISRDSIARLLQAGTIVDGSIQRVRSGVRLDVRLVDGNSGREFDHLRLEAPDTGLLALRDSLAQAVAQRLRVLLGDELQLRRSLAGTRAFDAWSLVQRAEKVRKEAQALWTAGDSAGSLASLLRADTLLAHAETRDDAWVQPIVLRAQLAYEGAERIPAARLAREWIDRGLEHADRALALEPRNGYAIAARGSLRFLRFGRQLARDKAEEDELLRLAQQDLQDAVRIEPTHARAWSLLSTLQYRKLDVVGANLSAQRAYEEDAFLSAADEVLWRLFATSYDLNQVERARHWCGEGHRRFPTSDRFVQCRLWLMTMPLARSDPAEAWHISEQVLAVTPEPQRALRTRELQMLVAATLARAGHGDSARRVIERARAGSEIDPQRKLLWIEALARMQLGEREQALQLLKLFLTEFPQHRAGLARNTWWWQELQQDPTYRALVGTG